MHIHIGILFALYVIKFVSDFRQDGGCIMVLRFPPQIKLIPAKYLKYC